MNDEFLIGFGMALADLNRLHDEPVAVADTISGAGLTIADFKRAGMEEYDLKELRKCVEQGAGSLVNQRALMGPSHGKT